jgi:hypothetical protein
MAFPFCLLRRRLSPVALGADGVLHAILPPPRPNHPAGCLVLFFDSPFDRLIQLLAPLWTATSMPSPLYQTRRLAVHAMTPDQHHTHVSHLLVGPSTNVSLAWGIGNNTAGYRTAGPPLHLDNRDLSTLGEPTSADMTLRQGQ